MSSSTYSGIEQSATPTATEQLLARAGMEHGTELLSDPVVRSAVLDFLASHDG